MSDSDSLFKNHISDLASRCIGRGVWTYSDFLTLAEQDILLRMRFDAPFSLAGGIDQAERKIAVFGSEELCGWTEEPPIVCVRIEPVNTKFAEKLTHRDFLGSLMGLGIKREVLGDLVISGSTGYQFCLGSISQYIIDSLTSVRRTTVRCSLSDPPESVTAPPEATELVVASERLDALIAAVYRLSRSESQELISSGRVFLSGRLCQSASSDIREGELVSVRGVGRFLYEGVSRETKRGRIRVTVRIYK